MFRLIRLIRQTERRNAPLFVVGVFIFFWTLAIGAFELYLPIFIENIVDNFIQVGFLLALPSIVALLVDMPIGDLCDRLGNKYMIMAGILITVIVGAIFRFVSLPLEAVAILILFGFAYQFIVVPTIAYVMEISPKKKTSEYFGAYDTFYSLGYVIGPVIGGFLLASIASYIFDFMIIMSLLSFSVVYFGIHERKKYTTFLHGLGVLIKKDKLFLADIREYKKLGKTGIMIIYLSVLFAFWDGLIWTVVPLFSESTFFTAFYAGLVLAAFTVPFVIFQLPAGFVADRYGKNKIIFLGFLVGGIFMMLFSLTTNPVLLVIFAFLAATGGSIAFPCILGYLTDISTKKKGEISGVRAFAEDVGYVLGPIMGGVLVFTLGFGNTFVAVGIILIVSAFMSLFVHGKNHKSF